MRRTLVAALLLFLAGTVLGGAVSTASAMAAKASSQTSTQAKPISDSQLTPSTTTVGGATVQPTTRTVAHWWGSTLDPDNGVTYGYNMVGANPYTCSGSACSTTITADIVPVNVVVGGLTFTGSDVVDPTLASPLFSTNDYGTTPAATAAGNWPGLPQRIRGPGGTLSQEDAGNQLQLEDATMRAQFDRTGSSPYHLLLNPVVHDPVTLVVPRGEGTLLTSPVGGNVLADIDYQWWLTQIWNLDNSLSYIDPTHLSIYLTHDVALYTDQNPFRMILGFHGTGPGSQNGSGNQLVQTFAWASYFSPGVFARPDGGSIWAVQDIHLLSHEISEWADDPFITNTVEPWSSPTAPQYGCSNQLETGDPVYGIGFAMGTNTYEQGPNPNGTQSADGYYHPEDEAFLPWFMRSSPNTISEPTQSPSTNIGRYTLMGDLNPFPFSRQPAPDC